MDEKITIDSFNFYKESLYYLCNLLIPNLEYYLQEEGRYYGRVKSYLDSIKLAEKNGKEKIDDTNTIHYGKVVSLVKNQIKRDFQRLSKRRMSCADRIIILMRWILKIIDFVPSEDFKFEKESQTYAKILEHLYDNIRNKSKKDTFKVLTKTIERIMNGGEYGNSIVLSIDLVNTGFKKDLEGKRKKKEFQLDNSLEIFSEENSDVLAEVNLMTKKEEGD